MFEKIHFKEVELKRKKTFHDRHIRVTLVNEDGEDADLVYDMGSGLDYLTDTTRVMTMTLFHLT